MAKAKQHKLTPERRQLLLEAAQEGCPNAEAAAHAGIGDRTLYGWLADPELAEFAEDYTRARLNGRRNLINLITTHAERDWRAASWLLERQDPNNWGGKDLDPEVLERLMNAYLKGHQDATANEKADA